MSTSATVRAAWNTKVWLHATIQALTTKIYNYDLHAMIEDSTPHLAKALEDTLVNFIQYRVTKSWEFGQTGSYIFKFLVEIEYYKQANLDGTIDNSIEDAFETIAGLVASELGTSWNATVDHYEPQEGPGEIAETAIDGRTVYKGSYSFTGTQTVSK